MRTALRDNGLRNILRKVPPSAVLYYPGLDYGNWHTGTIRDYSGLANDGTITGATAPAGAILPSGLATLRFGGDDFVDIGIAVNDLAATTKGTWMTWIKLDDATPVATTRIFAFGDTNAFEIIAMSITTAGIFSASVRAATVLKWALATDAAAVSDGKYAHIALIQDGTSPVLLVNGVQVAQTFTDQTDKTSWFSVCTGLDNGRIGCDNYNNAGNLLFVTNGNLVLEKLISTNLTVAQLLSIVQLERRYLGV